jgi:hypothetical protein
MDRQQVDVYVYAQPMIKGQKADYNKKWYQEVISPELGAVVVRKADLKVVDRVKQ